MEAPRQMAGRTVVAQTEEQTGERQRSARSFALHPVMVRAASRYATNEHLKPRTLEFAALPNKPLKLSAAGLSRARGLLPLGRGSTTRGRSVAAIR